MRSREKKYRSITFLDDQSVVIGCIGTNYHKLLNYHRKNQTKKETNLEKNKENKSEKEQEKENEVNWMVLIYQNNETNPKN